MVFRELLEATRLLVFGYGLELGISGAAEPQLAAAPLAPPHQGHYLLAPLAELPVRLSLLAE